MSELVSIFTRLASITSPSRDEGAMADFLVDFFNTRCMPVLRDTINNVFVRIPGVGEPLFLAAHTDTLSHKHVIVPVVKKGTITSRGDTILGADNKATIAVILSVIEQLKDIQHRPLEILFEVDEEETNTGARQFDYSHISATKGLIADIALPVGTIVLGSAAYMRFDIKFLGKGGHAAFPNEGQNIVQFLGSILSGIKTGELDKKTILNIGFGMFGDSRNAVARNASIHGEFRSFDEVRLQKHWQTFIDFIETRAKILNIQTKIESAIDNHSYVFSKSDSYIKKLARAMYQQGVQPAYVKSWSVSDANIFNTKNLQVVNMGDGTRDTHTIHESITQNDMENLASIYKAVCLMQ